MQYNRNNNNEDTSSTHTWNNCYRKLKMSFLVRIHYTFFLKFQTLQFHLIGFYFLSVKQVNSEEIKLAEELIVHLQIQLDRKSNQQKVWKPF